MESILVSPVLASLESGVLRITLNRPDKLNTFNPAGRKGIAAFLEKRKPEFKGQ